MNILTISTYYSRGGAAAIAKNIHSNLGSYSNRQYNCKFLYAFDKGGKQNVEADGVIAVPYLHKYVPHLNFLSHRITGIDLFGANEKNFSDIINWADIVHLHIIHTHGFNYEQLVNLININNIKVVITLHDSWFYTGRCAIIGNCNDWQKGCSPCLNKKFYPKTIIDFAAKEFQKKVKNFNSIKKLIFISPSQWIADNLAMVYPSKDVRVIRNGIDTRDFDYQKYGLPMNSLKSKYLFITNDFNEEVKVDMPFLTNLVASNAEIHLIGANSPFKGNNVYNYGYLNDKEKYLEILHRADAILFFSVIDNYPTVIIEGLCAGLHVLAYPSKGVQEVTQEFKSRLSLFNSFEEFTNIVVKQRDFALISKAKEVFSSIKMIDAYKKLYETL